jgi:hypothetical protein
MLLLDVSHLLSEESGARWSAAALIHVIAGIRGVPAHTDIIRQSLDGSSVWGGAGVGGWPQFARNDPVVAQPACRPL